MGYIFYIREMVTERLLTVDRQSQESDQQQLDPDNVNTGMDEHQPQANYFHHRQTTLSVLLTYMANNRNLKKSMTVTNKALNNTFLDSSRCEYLCKVKGNVNRQMCRVLFPFLCRLKRPFTESLSTVVWSACAFTWGIEIHQSQ